MRRLALIIALLLVLAACSGGTDSADNTTAAPTDSVVEETAATAAETTTTAAETTTSVAQTTTTAAETTSTAVPGELVFETSVGTPPDAFDSFTAELSMTFEMEGTAITVGATGTWTEDAFECTMSSEFGGLSFKESIIATPETLWYDQGNGYEESDLFSGSAGGLVSSCPAAPLFWAEFSTEDMGMISGDPTDFNGRSAYKTDLTEFLGALGGLGMAGVSDDMIEDMQVWIDEETTTIIGLYTELEMPSELLEGSGVEGSTTMIMQFSLDNFNDPALSIELP